MPLIPWVWCSYSDLTGGTLWVKEEPRLLVVITSGYFSQALFGTPP